MIDRIVFGNVLTLDAASSRAEGLAISGGSIVAVGSRTELMAMKSAETRVDDFGTATIIPGFNDTHAHVTAVGLRSQRPSLEGARSISEIQQRIRALAAETPKGEWIVTMPVGPPPYYFDGPTGLSEQRMPDRSDLDAAAPDHPVYLSCPGGYWGQMPLTGAMNSLALRQNGIDRNKQPTASGIEIERNAAGEPTGVFREKNFASVIEVDLFPAVPRFDGSDRMAALQHAIPLFHSKGTTSVYEGHGAAPDVMAAFRNLHERGELTLRTSLVVAPTWRSNEEARRMMELDLVCAQGQGIGDAMLRVSGIFIPSYGNMKNNRFFDQDLSDLGWSDYNRATLDPEHFEDLALIAAQNDLRVHTVVSDRLAHVAPILKRIDSRYPLAGRRWVAEHISTASREGLEVLRQVGAGVTLIPANYVWKTGHLFADNPEAPLDLLSPAKALMEMGVPVAASTDGCPYDPLVVMWAMVRRVMRETGEVAGSGGCLSNEQALRALTCAGAWLSFDEIRKGQLVPGFYADLAVFDKSPLETIGDEILDNPCLATMVAGKWVYRAN